MHVTGLEIAESLESRASPFGLDQPRPIWCAVWGWGTRKGLVMDVEKSSRPSLQKGHNGLTHRQQEQHRCGEFR